MRFDARFGRAEAGSLWLLTGQKKGAFVGSDVTLHGMSEPLRLFVSATNDLDDQRAVIGRALARLPVQLGMEIRRTPATGASWETMHELVANVDRFYFLLGEDITAPAGAEWQLAWMLERRILPLRHLQPSETQRLTPAGEEFLRVATVPWQWFATSADLVRIVSLDAIELLLHPANRFGLKITELEALRGYAAQIARTPLLVRHDPGGAEGGGVLLDDGRREPLLGVALDEP